MLIAEVTAEDERGVQRALDAFREANTESLLAHGLVIYRALVRDLHESGVYAKTPPAGFIRPWPAKKETP